MVRKQRKRISYVLPLASSSSGHRLGVNGLAVDPHNSILYTGGRDGVICAWDLNLDLSPFGDQDDDLSVKAPAAAPASTLRQQVQAHTHWINDIALAEDHQALISASSDISVKVWRPAAADLSAPQTIGLHSDYVKRLAYAGQGVGWVASGGLDRKIHLWDLQGHGEQLKFNVGEEENTAKGSVYALAVTPTLLASGGPESIVRVWDLRSARQVTKLVGHTDNIRDILISQDGDTLMTASSDQTVKVWSMTAGRCMFTLTMHHDSVWSLHSDHPRLSIFHSSDRSGIVAKTDTRGCVELDDGLSIAVCQEPEGVSKVIGAGDYLWTTTSSSSVNRWRDIDSETDVQEVEPYSYRRGSVATTRSRAASPPASFRRKSSAIEGQIPAKSILRMSNAVPFRPRRDTEATTLDTARRASVVEVMEAMQADNEAIQPVRSSPDHTIEGQHGLIKHVMLNDRHRVLTLDTAGEVMMWDLLKCIAVKNFGKREIDDVLAEVQTTETVPYWCSVDTRTGSLTCILEEHNCFDAEMYADELTLDDKLEFREDQRINLGKWILRYLFSYLIDEEIRRDETIRKQLIETRASMDRPNAPMTIQMPAQTPGWRAAEPTSASTLRPTNGFHVPVMPTPGFNIGLATPGAPLHRADTNAPPLPPIPDEASAADRPSGNNDYFSVPFLNRTADGNNPATPGGESVSTPTTEQVPQSPSLDKNEAPGTAEKAEKGLFGSKKFRMNFNMRSLTKTKTNDAPTSNAVAKTGVPSSEDGNDPTRDSKTEENLITDNFLGALQKIRLGYEESAILLRNSDTLAKQRQPDYVAPADAFKIESAITPSLPNDTPVLKPPTHTKVLIQEDRIDSGGIADLFEGTVGSLGSARNTSLIEQTAPMWLADCLLRNQIPQKEIVKISFVLEPYQGQLPSIASDGETNTRLNANRMLRARKIMSYVAERIEPTPERPEPGALKPEEYLELYCQNQLIHPTMTLATIRSHIWRGAGDVVLYYKANGKKQIRYNLLPPASRPNPYATPGRSMGSFSGPSPGTPGGLPMTPGGARMGLVNSAANAGRPSGHAAQGSGDASSGQNSGEFRRSEERR